MISTAAFVERHGLAAFVASRASTTLVGSRPELPVKYKGQILKKRYRPDFVVYDRMILQIASQPALTQEDEDILRQYLRMCAMKSGLLVNFGAPTLEVRRIVL